MRKLFLYIVLQLAILTTFFFPGFTITKGDVTEGVIGIEAIVRSDFPWIGRFVLLYILLSVIFHLLTLIYELVKRTLPEKLDQTLTVILTLQMIAGLLVVTFMGTFTHFFGFMMIGLILLSIFTKYKYFKA
ncbi:MAG: hypothetical protein EP317_01510 [Bacillota bacterium]|nr:MAG: hypothetical protein EP317_01510 [Bacillota bacterium]